jgi:hypothetical protein
MYFDVDVLSYLLIQVPVLKKKTMRFCGSIFEVPKIISFHLFMLH